MVQGLDNCPEINQTVDQLVQQMCNASQSIQGVREPQDNQRASYKRTLDELTQIRGTSSFLPLCGIREGAGALRRTGGWKHKNRFHQRNWSSYSWTQPSLMYQSQPERSLVRCGHARAPSNEHILLEAGAKSSIPG